MLATHTITNHFTDFRLLDLSKVEKRLEERGPFILVQDGSAPEDPRMRECSFVLTKRGTWLHFYLYLALPKGVQRHCAQFETAAEAMKCADCLPGKVVVEDAASLQELIHEAGFEPEDVAGQTLLAEMKAKHSKSAAS